MSNHVVINQNRKYEISQKQTHLFLQVNNFFISKIVMSLHSLIKSMVGLNNYCKYCFFTNSPGILKIFCLQPAKKENKINVIIGHVCIQHTCMSKKLPLWVPNNILNGRHKILNLTCQNFWEERNENLKVVKGPRIVFKSLLKNVIHGNILCGYTFHLQ